MLIATSCNKVKKTKKKLSGTWEIVEYKYQNPTGLIYIYPCQGTFNFDNCESDLCSYAFNYEYTADGISTTINNMGTYTILSEVDKYHLIRENTDGTMTTLDKCRNILLTKDELKTQFQDETGIHYFILNK